MERRSNRNDQMFLNNFFDFANFRPLRLACKLHFWFWLIIKFKYMFEELFLDGWFYLLLLSICLINTIYIVFSLWYFLFFLCLCCFLRFLLNLSTIKYYCLYLLCLFQSLLILLLFLSLLLSLYYLCLCFYLWFCWWTYCWKWVWFSKFYCLFWRVNHSLYWGTWYWWC